MGGVFYHQACDNYFDEKMNADKKPNDKPYKDRAYYTGKGHSWDEAFSYWGAAAHGATFSPKQNYNITKKKNMRDADANGNGVVNLKSEMNYAYIAIRYPQAIERLLMSPAQHQLHHSQSEQHYDRNFGVALSVWDRMFGSSHHSVSETLSFGIGNETARFTGSIWSMYWLLSEASHGASPAHVLPLTGRLPARSHASVRGITDHGTA